MNKPDDFTETHDTRMIRKFGSQKAFDRVKISQALVPRGEEVGLDIIGFIQDNLDKRIQSSK
jgi:hypothetical protein